MKTVFIHGGRLVDPSQNVDGLADLFCVDGKVSEVLIDPTPESVEWWKRKADTVIDASGKIVCPGFVDIHMHEDPLNEDENSISHNITRSMALMGVTTAVGGRGQIGEFGWDGAAGAWVMIDPINHIAAVYTQHILGCGRSYDEFHPTMRDLIYEALEA